MSADHASLTRSAAFASIAMALFLGALKAWAVWRTGSTAMLGSLADTALDFIASVVTLAGVWIAAHPADEDHRFGHGKAEALAAMVQVILIVLSASAIAFRAVQRLVEGGRTEAAEQGIAVSAAAIVATFALLAWQRHVIRKTGSLAIRTDNVHYQSDLYLNLAVIAALVLDQHLGFTQADPLFGLAIAAWLHFVRRQARRGIALVDPLAEPLAALGRACCGNPETDVAAFLTLESVFGDLATHPHFIAALRTGYAALGDGTPPSVAQALEQAASAQPSLEST